MIYFGFFRLGITNLLMWSVAAMLFAQLWLCLRKDKISGRRHDWLLGAIAWFFLLWGLFYDFPLWIPTDNPNYYAWKTAIGFISMFPIFAANILLFCRRRG